MKESSRGVKTSAHTYIPCFIPTKNVSELLCGHSLKNSSEKDSSVKVWCPLMFGKEVARFLFLQLPRKTVIFSPQISLQGQSTSLYWYVRTQNIKLGACFRPQKVQGLTAEFTKLILQLNETSPLRCHASPGSQNRVTPLITQGQNIAGSANFSVIIQ